MSRITKSNERLGLTAVVLFLLSVTALGAAELDWSTVVWNDGDLTNTYLLDNGVSVTITVSTMATGTFADFGVTSPYEDGPGGSENFFGQELDLGVIFNPDPGQGSSPVVIEVEFSKPVSGVSFEISDIDYSVGGGGEDARVDQVVITSDAGVDPILTPADANDATRTFSLSGTTATAIVNRTAMAMTHNGTLEVDYGGNLVSTITLTYNEASGNDNPAGRGIGLLAMLVEVPVELMSFSVD